MLANGECLLRTPWGALGGQGPSSARAQDFRLLDCSSMAVVMAPLAGQ
jgi:hypothetical protein